MGRERLNKLVRATDRWTPWLVLVASLSLNVYLGWRVLNPPEGVERAKLTVGEVAQNLSFKRLDGSSVKVDWAAESRQVVLYFFEPSCVWCKRNLEGAKKVAPSVPT